MNAPLIFRYRFKLATDTKMVLDDLSPVIMSSPGYDERILLLSWSDERSPAEIQLLDRAGVQIASITVSAFPDEHKFSQRDLEQIVDDYRLSDMFEPRTIIQFRCNYEPLFEMQAILTALIESNLYTDCLVEYLSREQEVCRRRYGWVTDWTYPRISASEVFRGD